MTLSNIINDKLINLELKSKTKDDVIKELVNLLDGDNRLLDKDKYYNAVLEREKTFSTGIGMGVAIPHGKSNGVKEASIAFGRSKDGIDFGSMDGEPAFIFFLISVPNNADNTHLKLLSQLSRNLMHQNVRDSLMKAESTSEIIKILNF